MTRPRGPEAEDLTRTASALRAVYTSVLPRLHASNPTGAGRLGYATPSYNRACVRTHQYFIALADELGEWWYRLQQDAMKDDPSVRRIVREHLEEAAVELADYVARLPAPLREVVELKSAGLSWKQVMKHPRMQDRVYWSVMDDWNTAMRLVWEHRGDLVRRLI